jgi:hypothetical protein
MNADAFGTSEGKYSHRLPAGWRQAIRRGYTTQGREEGVEQGGQVRAGRRRAISVADQAGDVAVGRVIGLCDQFEAGIGLRFDRGHNAIE